MSATPPRLTRAVTCHRQWALIAPWLEQDELFPEWVDWIVVNDCPADPCRAPLAARLAARGARLIELPVNRGRCLARNLATAAARTEWIEHIDGDDTPLPVRLEMLAHAGDADVVFTPVVEFADGTPPPRTAGAAAWTRETHTYWGFLVPEFAPCDPRPAGTLWRRASLLALDGYDARFEGVEDNHLAWFARRHGLRAAHWPEPKQAYRLQARMHILRSAEGPQSLRFHEWLRREEPRLARSLGLLIGRQALALALRAPAELWARRREAGAYLRARWTGEFESFNRLAPAAESRPPSHPADGAAAARLTRAVTCHRQWPLLAEWVEDDELFPEWVDWIVVNDAPTDACPPALAARLAARGARLITPAVNRGYAAARNLATAAARTEWIEHIDGDDTPLPVRPEMLAHAGDADVVFTPVVEFVDGAVPPRRAAAMEWTAATHTYWGFVAPEFRPCDPRPAGRLWRRASLNALHGYDGRFQNGGEDVQLTWIAAALGLRAAHWPEPKQAYRLRASRHVLRRRNGAQSLRCHEWLRAQDPRLERPLALLIGRQALALALRAPAELWARRREAGAFLWARWRGEFETFNQRQ